MNEKFEFKSAASGAIALDELQGIVECFVAGIGNKDSVGDIVVTGAFAKSLTRRKPRVVWAHSWNDPIGKVLEMYEVPAGDPRLPAKMRNAGIGGLYAKVQFNLQSEKGKEAFASVAFFGEEQEWSIGYKTINGAFDPAQQANVLREVELYEVSPVLHGANQLTGTISVKSEQKNHMMPVIAGMPMMNEQQQPRMIVIAAPEKEQEEDEPFNIFAEGLAQPLEADKVQKIQAELSERTGSKVDIVEATDSFIVFRRTTSDGKVSMYRVGYHSPDDYNTFMFGKPEVYSGSTDKPQMQQEIEVKPADESMVPAQPQQMPYRDDDQDEMNTMLGGQVGVGKSAYAHLIEIPQIHMMQAKSMLQPVFNYHNLSTTDSDNGIIVNGSISAQAIDALQTAVKAIGQTIGQSVGNLRTLAQSFNPFAIDGDNDGFAQDGTTFQRPYIPIKKPDMNLPEVGGKNRDSNELLDKPTIRTGKKPMKDPSLLSGAERQEALAAGDLQPRTMDDISFLANRRPENEGIAKYWDMPEEGLRAEGQKLVAARREQTGSAREATDGELFKISHEFARREAYKQQFGKDFVPPKRTESTGRETFDASKPDEVMQEIPMSAVLDAMKEWSKSRSTRGFGSRGDVTPEQQSRIDASRKRGSDVASGRGQILADNIANLSDDDKDYIRENGIVSYLLQDGTGGPLSGEWAGDSPAERIGDLLPEGDWSTDSKLQADAEDIFASYEEGFYAELDKDFAERANPADLDTPKAKRDRQRAAGQGEMFSGDDFDNLSADEQDLILEQGRDSARGFASRGEGSGLWGSNRSLDPDDDELSDEFIEDYLNDHVGDGEVEFEDLEKFNDKPEYFNRGREPLSDAELRDLFDRYQSDDDAIREIAIDEITTRFYRELLDDQYDYMVEQANSKPDYDDYEDYQRSRGGFYSRGDRLDVQGTNNELNKWWSSYDELTDSEKSDIEQAYFKRNPGSERPGSRAYNPEVAQEDFESNPEKYGYAKDFRAEAYSALMANGADRTQAQNVTEYWMENDALHDEYLKEADGDSLYAMALAYDNYIEAAADDYNERQRGFGSRSYRTNPNGTPSDGYVVMSDGQSEIRFALEDGDGIYDATRDGYRVVREVGGSRYPESTATYGGSGLGKDEQKEILDTLKGSSDPFVQKLLGDFNKRGRLSDKQWATLKGKADREKKKNAAKKPSGFVDGRVNGGTIAPGGRPVVSAGKDSIVSPTAEQIADADGLEKLINDARRDGQTLRFNYNGKDREVFPVQTFKNPKTGKVNMVGQDSEGVKKTFTIDKMSPSSNAGGFASRGGEMQEMRLYEDFTSREQEDLYESVENYLVGRGDLARVKNELEEGGFDYDDFLQQNPDFHPDFADFGDAGDMGFASRSFDPADAPEYDDSEVRDYYDDEVLTWAADASLEDFMELNYPSKYRNETADPFTEEELTKLYNDGNFEDIVAMLPDQIADKYGDDFTERAQERIDDNFSIGAADAALDRRDAGFASRGDGPARDRTVRELQRIVNRTSRGSLEDWEENERVEKLSEAKAELNSALDEVEKALDLLNEDTPEWEELFYAQQDLDSNLSDVENMMEEMVSEKARLEDAMGEAATMVSDAEELRQYFRNIDIPSKEDLEEMSFEDANYEFISLSDDITEFVNEHDLSVDWNPEKRAEIEKALKDGDYDKANEIFYDATQEIFDAADSKYRMAEAEHDYYPFVSDADGFASRGGSRFDTVETPNSSAIEAVHYDRNTRELHVAFKPGQTGGEARYYTYSDVSPDYFDNEVAGSNSIGRVINDVKKNHDVEITDASTVDAINGREESNSVITPVRGSSEIKDIDVRRSAALYESYYDPNTEELVVTFKDKDGNAGGSYIYEGVNADEAQELASSSSKGKVINKLKASKPVRRASATDRMDRDPSAGEDVGSGSFEAQVDSHWGEIGPDEQRRYFARAVDSAINAGSGTSAEEITADAKARAFDDRQIAMMEMQAESLGMGYRNVDVGSSAALNRVQYDQDKRELRVEYRGRDGKGTGEFYVYENVPQSVVDDLEASDSRGSTLRRVRDDFDFRREEAIPESAFYSMGEPAERSNPKITNRTNENGFYLDENGKATNYNKRAYTTGDVQKMNARRNGRDGFASRGDDEPSFARASTPTMPDIEGMDEEEASDALEKSNEELLDFIYQTEKLARMSLGEDEYLKQFSGAVPYIEELSKNHDGGVQERSSALESAIDRAMLFEQMVGPLGDRSDGFASRGSINESSTGQRIVPSRMHSDDREALAEITDPEERKQRIDSLIEFYGPRIFAKPSAPKRKPSDYDDEGFLIDSGFSSRDTTPKTGGDRPKVDPLSILGGYSDGDVFGLTPRGFASRGASGSKKKTKEEVYAEMTKQLIDALSESEKLGKWQLPWRRMGMPENGTSGHKYSGSNWFFLTAMADIKGYNSNKWATYDQWQGIGGQVRKGEKATSIFVPIFLKGKEKADGTEEKGRISFISRSVFNLDQIDGMPADFDKKEILPESERVADLEKTISEIPAVIKNGGDEAYFSPSEDFIQLPLFENFKDARAYYSTAAHELMHWTGGKDRLGRENMNRFGTPEYAYEELVAEIASAMFMAAHNIEPNIQDNHGPYLASWIKKLKDDPTALERAMKDAQSAVNYVLDVSPNAKSKFSNGEKAVFENPDIAVPTEAVVAVEGFASRGDWPTPGGYEPGEFDMRTALSQIGRGNLMAISGTRANKRNNEMVLPVNRNQQVIVGYDGGSDTYFVRAEQIITNGRDKGKTRVLGQWDNVYADELGETAYQASLKPSMLSDENKTVWAQAFDHPQTGSLLDENGRVYENGFASGGDSMDPDELDAMDWAYDAAQDYLMEKEDMMPEEISPEDGFASRVNLSREEKNEIIAIARRMGNRFTTSVVGQYDRNGELSDKQWDALNRMTLRKQGDSYVRNTRGLASRGDKKPRTPKASWSPEDRQRYADGDKLRSTRRPGKRREGPSASEYGFSSRGEPIDMIASDIFIGDDGAGRSWGFEPIIRRAARKFDGQENMSDEQLAAELRVPLEVAKKMRKQGARTRDVYLLDNLRIQVGGDRDLWGVDNDPLSYYDESGNAILNEDDIPDTGDLAPDAPGARSPRLASRKEYLDARPVLDEIGISETASQYSIMKDNSDIFSEKTWRRILAQGITRDEANTLLKAKKSEMTADSIYGEKQPVKRVASRTDSLPLADVFSNQAFDSTRGRRGFPQQVVDAIFEITGRKPSISTVKKFINDPQSSGKAAGRAPFSLNPLELKQMLEKLGISSEEFDKFRSE